MSPVTTTVLADSMLEVDEEVIKTISGVVQLLMTAFDRISALERQVEYLMDKDRETLT